MTLEHIRQALLRLAELDRQKSSFQAMIAGADQRYQQEFDLIRKQVEATTPGWEIQKMANAWAHTWVLLPVKESEA